MDAWLAAANLWHEDGTTTIGNHTGSKGNVVVQAVLQETYCSTVVVQHVRMEQSIINIVHKPSTTP
jgi:hypothetical protein